MVAAQQDCGGLIRGHALSHRIVQWVSGETNPDVARSVFERREAGVWVEVPVEEQREPRRSGVPKIVRPNAAGNRDGEHSGLRPNVDNPVDNSEKAVAGLGVFLGEDPVNDRVRAVHDGSRVAVRPGVVYKSEGAWF